MLGGDEIGLALEPNDAKSSGRMKTGCKGVEVMMPKTNQGIFVNQ